MLLTMFGFRPASKTLPPHRPSLFLHIGPPKTGTTYFQTQLCENRAALQDLGYRLPVCRHCRRCNPKHFFGLALQLVNASAVEWERASTFACTPDAVSCFQEALSAIHQPAIVSTEMFVTLNDAHAARLAGLLSAYEVHVVLVHRAKLPHLLAHYSEIFSPQIAPVTLVEFLSYASANASAGAGHDGVLTRQLIPPPGLYIARQVARYSSVFGATNVHVLSYDGLVAAGVDLFQAFVDDILRLPADALRVTPLPKQNPSMAAVTLSIEAFLRRYLQAKHNVSALRFPPSCLTPAAERLAKVLPLLCGHMGGAIESWEREELEELRSSGARLYYFDRVPGARTTNNDAACDVDQAALLTRWEFWTSLLEQEIPGVLLACTVTA
jgi:hypothetical protein